MRDKLKPYAIALGSIVGLIGIFVLLYVVSSLWGLFLMGDRPERAVDQNAAMAECARSLGDYCRPLASRYLDGKYKENFLVGGVTTLNFAVGGKEREQLIKEFYLLPGYDYERKGIKNCDLYVFAYRVGKDRLQLAFSLD